MVILADREREKATFEVKPNVLRDIKTLAKLSGFDVMYLATNRYCIGRKMYGQILTIKLLRITHWKSIGL